MKTDNKRWIVPCLAAVLLVCAVVSSLLPGDRARDAVETVETAGNDADAGTAPAPGTGAEPGTQATDVETEAVTLPGWRSQSDMTQAVGTVQPETATDTVSASATATAEEARSAEATDTAQTVAFPETAVWTDGDEPTATGTGEADATQGDSEPEPSLVSEAGTDEQSSTEPEPIHDPDEDMPPSLPYIPGGIPGSVGLSYRTDEAGNAVIIGIGACTDSVLWLPAQIGEQTVAGIAANAFRGCDQVTAVYIPASLTHIGAGAFASCPKLSDITVDARNPAYASDGGVLYDKGKTVLICYPSARAGDYYVLPPTLAAIADGAFGGHTALLGVMYVGSRDDWARLYIGYGNNGLAAAGVRFVVDH